MDYKRWLVKAYDKGKYSNHKLIKDKDKKARYKMVLGEIREEIDFTS